MAKVPIDSRKRGKLVYKEEGEKGYEVRRIGPGHRPVASRPAPIFTLTTLHEDRRWRKDGTSYTIYDHRCVGWWPTFAQAEKALTSCVEGWWEYRETHALIETVYAGAYAGLGDKRRTADPEEMRVWYAFVVKKKRSKYDVRVKKISCPKQWKNIVNWSLG